MLGAYQLNMSTDTSYHENFDYETHIDLSFLFIILSFVCAFSLILGIRIIEHQFRINAAIKEVLYEFNQKIIELEKEIIVIKKDI